MSSALFILFCVITESYTARILAVFPSPSVSHQVVFRPLTLELAKRGHELTIITPDPIFNSKSTENYREIDVHNISYSIWQSQFVYNVGFGMKENMYPQMETLLTMITEVISVQLEQPEVQQLIKNQEKYDLLLLEAWPRQALVYTYLFKAPAILISSLAVMFGKDEDNVGAPKHPFLYPMMLQQKIYNLTFWEKIEELSKRIWFYGVLDALEAYELEVFRKQLGADLPSYEELSNNIDMLFLNSHPMWMNNQPLPPNVITMWGIHKNPEKTLPSDLQNYLDSSKNGVIYLSFGSNVFSSLLAPEKIQVFVRVFSKLPYDVLWKWETDVLPNKSDNIKISKWLPQTDVLKHPKIKFFITQGGLQSTDEAVSAGVPILGVPMFGDQWFNIDKILYYKIGVKVDMETITEEVLEETIQNMLSNRDRYRENTIRLRKLMVDQPQSALERAVWWTEYVLRHGGAKHLRAATANMPWTEFYEIEFLLNLAAIAFGVLVSILFIFYLLWIWLCVRRKQKND
ncbi:unnamed protein product [Leptosia nina]|uniref:Glucuronosyltransferase n=1 Tax=Leptosia nina TaxID=320188 RepID=A0AAV1JE53_9NEOP